MVGDAVTTALVNYQFRGPFLETELFDVSWSTHPVVHQATGVVAEQLVRWPCVHDEPMDIANWAVSF